MNIKIPMWYNLQHYCLQVFPDMPPKKMHPSDLEIGKKYLAEHDYEKAIESFNTVLQTPSSVETVIDALMHKGQALAQWGKTKDALNTFSTILGHQPDNLEAKEHVANFWINIALDYFKEYKNESGMGALKKAQQYSPDNPQVKLLLSTQDAPIEDLIGPYVFNDSYKKALTAIKDKHKNVKTMKTVDKVEFLVELISFTNKYFKDRTKPYSFADARLFEENETGAKLRIKNIGFIFDRYRGLLNVSNDSQLDELCLDQFNTGIEDVYFTELFTILRMFFEVIHQLPRKEREKYNKLLPWDDNSWFYFEFLGCLFATDFSDNTMISIMIPGQLLKDYPSIQQFQQSIQEFVCLVKIASLAVISEDLPVFQAFFTSLHKHLSNPKQCEIAKMGNLPNLPVLLNYFRQSFNLFRLCSLLPNLEKQDPLIIIKEYEQSYNISPYNRFQMNNRTPTENDLKGRLAFLRQLASIGELFTNRSLGSELESLEFINPLALQAIRNGLAHIEELQSAEVIRKLEGDDKQLLELHSELLKLRTAILKHIAERQRQYPSWPDTAGPYEQWEKHLTSYWKEVTAKYKATHSSFDPNTLVFNQPLLASSDIQHLLSTYGDDTPENIKLKDRLKRQLNGSEPFVWEKCSYDKNVPHSRTTSAEEANQKYRSRLFKQANSVYSTLKTEYTRTKEKEGRDKYNAIKEKQNLSMQNFPVLNELANAFAKQLNDPQKMATKNVFVNLKLKCSQLNDLLKESQIQFDPNKPLSKQEPVYKKFQDLLKQDIQFFLAISYLVTQIIALLNVLSSSRMLPFLELSGNPEHQKWITLIDGLKTPLKDWVALRNILMHSDGIIDSDKLFYFQIHFHKLPLTISQFIVEFLFNYTSPLNAISLTALGDFVLNKQLQVRQESSLNFDYFNNAYHALFSKGIHGQNLRFIGNSEHNSYESKQEITTLKTN